MPLQLLVHSIPPSLYEPLPPPPLPSPCAQTTYASNTGSDAPNSKKLQRFLDDNWAWMIAQVAANSATDSYWSHVGSVVAQLQGLVDGQASAGGALSWKELYQGLLNGGDMFNLGALYGLSREQVARTPVLRRSKASGVAPRGSRNDHCSALVRLTPGARDIIVTHVSDYRTTARSSALL